MHKLNIVTQLLGFFLLAVIVNLLNIKSLLWMLLVVGCLLVLNNTSGFLRAIKRFRWLLIVMLGIFAFNTPGEHVANWPFSISPTYEGLTAGCTQALRIIVMLATLSLILALNSRQQLISGFYFIFSPLKVLGLEVERFAARLWLTLHYVELQREKKSQQDFFGRLKEMTSMQINQADEAFSIAFKVPQFGFPDYAAIAIMLIICIKALI